VYKPSTNGAIERFHRTLKGMLNKAFTELDTKKYLNILADILKNYNSTVHSATKHAPIDLHKADISEDKRLSAVDYIKEQATRMLKQTGAENTKGITVGDYVRVALSTVPAVAKIGNMRKKYLPQWSREIYKVTRVSKAGLEVREDKPGDIEYHLKKSTINRPITLEEFYLVNEDGSTKQGRQRYRADELQKINPEVILAGPAEKSTKQEVKVVVDMPASDTVIEEAAKELDAEPEDLKDLEDTGQAKGKPVEYKGKELIVIDSDSDTETDEHPSLPMIRRVKPTKEPTKGPARQSARQSARLKAKQRVNYKE